MELLKIAKERRATKNYNPDKLIDLKTLNYIFEVTNTAPTSIGLEQWRVLDIRDKKVKEELLPFINEGNRKRFLDSSDAVFFITKKESWFNKDNKVLEARLKRNLKGAEETFNKTFTEEEIKSTIDYIVKGDHANNNHDFDEWSKRQAYIASAYTMLAAIEKGVKSTPVEGFQMKLNDLLREKKLMDNDEALSVIVLLGYIDGVQYPYIGHHQRREEVKDKFKII